MQGDRRDRSQLYHKKEATQPISKSGVVILVVLLLGAAIAVLALGSSSQPSTPVSQPSVSHSAPLPKPTAVQLAVEVNESAKAAFNAGKSKLGEAAKIKDMTKAKPVYDAAIVYFTKAANAQSGFGAAYYYRGLAYKSIGADQAANADFTFAKQLGYVPTN